MKGLKRGCLHRLVVSLLPGLLLPGLGLLHVARGQTAAPSQGPASASHQKQKRQTRKTNPPSRQKSRSSSKTSSNRGSSQKTSSPTKKNTAGSPRQRRRKASAALRQSHPTQDRYAEIQEGLAKAGYFQGPANGVWGQTSVKALQQFQKDNRLEPTGKIDSPSLIKLHLGPNYDGKTALVTGGAATRE